MPNEALGPGYVNFDFETWFPHLFWISDWKHDEEYPSGFRYKVLSARDELHDRVEVSVILEQRNGTQSEVARVGGPLSGARGVSAHWTGGLARRFGVSFEEQDFSNVRSQREFDVAAELHGWDLRAPE
jgi:hypothetical protein